MVSADRPEWTGKVRDWLTDTQYRKLNDGMGAVHGVVHSVLGFVDSRLENGAERLETYGLRAVCLYYGHKPVADGIDPDDDKCEFCEKPIPNSAHGPQY